MKAAERGIPMFGICLGSQLLASVLCGPGTVFRRASCEVGYKILKPTDDMTLTRLDREILPRFRCSSGTMTKSDPITPI